MLANPGPAPSAQAPPRQQTECVSAKRRPGVDETSCGGTNPGHAHDPDTGQHPSLVPLEFLLKYNQQTGISAKIQSNWNFC